MGRRDANVSSLPTAYSPLPHSLPRKSSELVRGLSRKQVASSARLWVRLPRLPLSSPLAPREERVTIGDSMSGALRDFVAKNGSRLLTPIVPSLISRSEKATHVPLAERQRHRASNPDRRVRLSQGTLDSRPEQQRVGSSAAEQVLVRHSRVGSSPTRPFREGSPSCGVVSAGRNPSL